MIANIILSDALSSTSAFELIQSARSIYENDILIKCLLNIDLMKLHTAIGLVGSIGAIDNIITSSSCVNALNTISTRPCITRTINS